MIKILTAISIIVVFSVLLVLKRALSILQEKQYHQAVEHHFFMEVLDKIFNHFLIWTLWKKIFTKTFVILSIMIASLFLYVRFELPIVPKVPNVVINHSDTVLLKRGAYLVENVATCTDCHSPRDVHFYSWPLVDEQKGAGGEFLSKSKGFDFPGESFTPNITPTNLGNWTDGEVYRLLTTGIRKDGSTVYHAMPFMAFSRADPNDIKAIIAYIRTLKPQPKNPASVTKVDYLTTLYNRAISREPSPVYLKDLKTKIDSGRYLVNMAGCNDCHSPKKFGDVLDKEKLLSGGIEFPMPTGGYTHSANLTPDESGLGPWSEEAFVAKFKSYNDAGMIQKIEPGMYSSLMPWYAFRKMTDRDLKSIYAYLRTIKPIYNPVVKFTKQSTKGKVDPE